MKIHVALEKCQNLGECCFAAPELFDLDDDNGLSWVAEPDVAQRDRASQAAARCPVAAITIED